MNSTSPKQSQTEAADATSGAIGVCPVRHHSGPGTQAVSDEKLQAASDLAAATAAAPTAHDGYFGPDSVSWKLYSDPSSKLGGVAGLLLQSLNPMMMRVFTGTSDYATDVEGRGERTGRYIDTTIFGDRAHADAAGEAVRRLHAMSVWTDPRTGEEHRADTEEWLAWTHNALIYGVLRAADAFGPQVTLAEQDRFVVEQHESARIVGITDDAFLPSSRRELDAYIDANKDWMALTLPAAEISRSMRAPVLKGNPIEVWAGVIIQDAVLSLLPDWAQLLFGIEGRPMNLRAAASTTRRIIARARAKASTEEMITEITERVRTHPYRKIRRR